MTIRNFGFLTRLLALILALTLAFSMSVSAVDVVELEDPEDDVFSGGDIILIDGDGDGDGGDDSGDGGGIIVTGDDDPASGADTSEADGDSEAAKGTAGNSEAEPSGPEETESSEEQEEKAADTVPTGDLSELVSAAALYYANGIELPDPAYVGVEDNLRLVLTIGADEQTLAALLENGVKEYTVHIPEKLAAPIGSYQLKLDKKILGVIHIEQDNAYFVFNTGEDSVLAEASDIEDLRLIIPCGLDEAAVDGEMEFTIELDEYEQGKAYNIKLINPMMIAPMSLPDRFDPTNDFTQFASSAILVKSGNSSAEMPGSFSLDFGEKIYLRFELHEIDGTELNWIKAANATYAITLPPELVATGSNVSIDIPDEDGKMTHLATISITADGTAYFEFDVDNKDIFESDISRLFNLWVTLECVLNEDAIGSNDRSVTINMSPYNVNKDYNVSIPSNIPQGEPSIRKSGENLGDGEYKWTVTVKAPVSTDPRDLIYGPLTDTTGTNHILNGPITVSGKPLGATEVITATIAATKGDTEPDANGFTLKDTGNGFIFTFTEPFTEGLTVTYKTKMISDAFTDNNGVPIVGDNKTATMENKADIVYGTPSQTLSDTYKITGENVSFLSKGGVFNYGKKTIEWTVVVDTLGQDYKYLTLLDQIAPAAPDKPQIKFATDSVTVTANGSTAKPENITWNSDYTLMTLPIWATQGGTAVNLYAPATVLTIKYSTPVPDGYVDYVTGDAEGVGNDAWLEFDWVDWTGGPGIGTWGKTERQDPLVGKEPQAVSAPIIKEALNYDPSTRHITWKITVNKNCLELHDAVVTDIIGTSDGYHEQLKYVEGSFSTSGEKEGEFDPRPDEGKFYLPEKITGEVTFKVTTLVTDPDFLISNSSKSFTNTATMAATAIMPYASGATTATKARTVKGDDSDTITPRNDVLSKSGKYDYSKHEMEWTIKVNEDKIDEFPNVIVTDTLPASQAIVPGSIKIVGTAGTVATHADTNGDTIIEFNLGDLSGTPYGTMVTITYKTTHQGLRNDTTNSMQFTNVVELDSNGATVGVTAPTQNIPLVPLNKKVKGVNKIGDSAAVVTYQVAINSSNIKFNNDIILKDTVTHSAVLGSDVEPDSVMLYNAALNKDTGVLSAIQDGMATVAVSSYNVVYSDAIGTGELTVTIPKDTKACILEYDVLIWHKSGGKIASYDVSNSIAFTNHDVGISNYSSDTDETSLGTASGAGGSLEKYLKVKIEKIDEKASPSITNKFIYDAEFGLYLEKDESVPATNAVPIATAKTDKNGVINFNLLMPSYALKAHEYFIKEIKAPTGYITPADDEYIKIATSGNGGVFKYATSSKTYSLSTPIKNERATYSVTFGKVAQSTNASGATTYTSLKDAVFTIIADSEYAGFDTRAATSGVDGVVTFDNLKWGTYTIEETKTPDTYVEHTCTYTLDITKTGIVSITTNDGTKPKIAVITVATGGYTERVPAIVNEKGSITLTKTDKETGAPIIQVGSGGIPIQGLHGATFVLEKDGDSGYVAEKLKKIGDGIYAPDSSGTATSADTNDKNGVVKFIDLDYGGVYRVSEVRAPTGFEGDENTGGSTIGDSIIATIGNAAGEPVHYAQNVPNTRRGMYPFSFKKHVSHGETSVPATWGTAWTGDEFELHKITETGTEAVTGVTCTWSSTSGVTFNNVAFGEYYVIENIPPASAAMPADSKGRILKVNIERKPNGYPEVTIKDLAGDLVTGPYINQKGSLEIRKKDNLYPETSAGLGGAVFKIEPKRAHITVATDTVTTENDGTILIDGLDTGKTYTFTEIKPPAGYATSAATFAFTPSTDTRYNTDLANIAIASNANTVNGYREFYNDRATASRTFSFTKVGDDEKPLEGVVFELDFAGTTPAGEQYISEGFPATTASTVGGKVSFENLPFGSYVIKELPKQGFQYILNTATIGFTVATNGVITASSGLTNGKFINERGSYTVTKRDAVNNDTISGVKFELDIASSGATGGWANVPLGVGKDTTNESGELEITGLYLETEYRLREVSTPDGYKSPTEAGFATFVLTDGSAINYYQSGDYLNYRDPKYSFGFKKDDGYGHLLDGAVFGLYASSACTAAYAVTGFDATTGAVATGGVAPRTATSGYTAAGIASSGAVVFSGLTFGKYYVKETVKAPVATDGRTTYKASDVILQVEIEKDGKYTIIKQSGSDTVTVTDGGTATNVSSGVMSDLTVPNKLQGSLTITKVDLDNTDKRLDGAVFELRKESGDVFVATGATSTPGGTVTFTGLELGTTYIVKEITAPAGYDKAATEAVTPEYHSSDETKYHMNITVENEKTGDRTFSFLKRDGVDNTAVAGAKFALYKDAGCTASPATSSGVPITETSDSSGIVQFENIKFGTYYVKEIIAAPGYVGSDTILMVEIDSVSTAATTITHIDGATTVPTSATAAGPIGSANIAVINNRAQAYSFGFMKDDGHGNLLNGAEFGLYASSACTATYAVTGFDATGAVATGGATHIKATSGVSGKGKVMFSGLPFGKYYVKETKTPVATDGRTTYKASDVVLKVEIAKTGTYAITKESGSDTLSNESAHAAGGLTVPNNLQGSVTIVKRDGFSGGKMSGVVFTLKDGVTEIASGATTGNNSEVTFTGLTLGKTYGIVETAPYGYEAYTATAAATYGVPTAHHVVKNVDNVRSEIYSVDFLKKDAFGADVQGAVFGIIKASDNANSATTGFTPTATAASTSTGAVTFTGLSFGTYFIREVGTPSATTEKYSLSDVVLKANIVVNADTGTYAVTIGKAGGADTVATDGNKTVVINYRAKYPFSFNKIASNTGNGLAGAVLSVEPIDEDSFGNTVVLSQSTATRATSNASGAVTFTVPYGKYRVSEVSAPTNHVKCEDTFDVEIDSSGVFKFSNATGGTSVVIATDGDTATVSNTYRKSSGGGSGGSSGSKGSSGGGGGGIVPPITPTQPSQPATVQTVPMPDDSEIAGILREPPPPPNISNAPDGSFIDGDGNIVKPPENLIPVEGLKDVYAEVDSDGNVIAYWKKVVVDGRTICYFLAEGELGSHNPGTGDDIIPWLVPLLAALALTALMIVFMLGYGRRYLRG